MTSEIKKTPTVCIVESLGFLEEDTHREGEIIARTLRLSGKETHYSYIRTGEELRAYVEEFGRSPHRYLHVSCHGNEEEFGTTTGSLDAEDFADLLAPHVGKRRVFLSACLAAESKFARRLLLKSECYSVLAPVGEIGFDDAAIFWTSFYHVMFKTNFDSMNRAAIAKVVGQCASLTGETFRLFWKHKGKVISQTIGPAT